MTEKDLQEIERWREEAIMATSTSSMAAIAYAHVPRLIAEIRRLNKVIYDMGLPDEPVKGGSPSPDAASIPNGFGGKL